MNWLSLATMAIEKIPFEKLLVRRSDNKERLKELAEILGESHAKPAEPLPEELQTPVNESKEETQLANLGNARPKVQLKENTAVTSTVSTKETVDYQNREIGKNLLMLQRHLVQKFRINGKACDCGQSRHLLDLESLVEETVGMVENPDVYYRILDWIKRLGPISTVENVTSGKYDDVYPNFSNEARDLRKEILGTLDPKALFPGKETEPAEKEEEIQEAE